MTIDARLKKLEILVQSPLIGGTYHSVEELHAAIREAMARGDDTFHIGNKAYGAPFDGLLEVV